MVRKLLVANRGEIAVRIIRACQEMGIASVAVYSDADAGAQHVALADEAVRLGPPPPQDSYLRAERVIEAARARGCDAIHPGYGFLSENPDFADAVRAAGLLFVGPTGAAMRAMGSKTAARRAATAAGVPVVPGYQESQEPADLRAAADRIGYPLLVKAVAGGGGKGMRRVEQADALPAALESARREAQNAFGDNRIYLEKWLPDPRHVEFQVVGDEQGALLHLFERECSVQRRHQKIIEETPSPLLDDALRAAMGAAAVAAARAVGYTNAGTVEFLVDAERRFYFLEMNTRLQVEHPVTELVTGIDLVKLQIRLAAGRPLPLRQEQVQARGHAIECRIYAEDPAAGFLPSTGRVWQAVEPVGPGVRVDAGVTSGDTVTLHYDPMIAKLIVLGEDRADAIGRMEWALRHYVLLGEVTTNIAFLRAVLAHPTFRSGEQTTGFVEREMAAWMPLAEAERAPPDAVWIAAALHEVLAGSAAGVSTAPAGPVAAEADPFSPWRQPSGFRLGTDLSTDLSANEVRQ